MFVLTDLGMVAKVTGILFEARESTPDPASGARHTRDTRATHDVDQGDPDDDTRRRRWR